MPESITIILILTLLGILFWLSSLGVNSGKLSAEWARKTVHIGMGLICLTFPWIFNSAFSVQCLAIIAMFTLLLLRYSKLRASVGTALFAIERLSIGELLFPIAVAWLFTLSADKPLLYAISLLLLTLADSAGALAGSRYGKFIYSTTAAKKSLEGSGAFFVTAFFCTALPLHFFSPLGLFHIALLALTISLFITAVEGACGHGTDNLLIPIGSFFLLDYYINLAGSAILIRSIALLVLLALLLATHRKHSLNGGALLTALLFGFSAFTLGGIPSLLASLVVLGRHIQVQSQMAKKHIVIHSVDVLVAIALVPLAWLTLGRQGVISYSEAQFGFISALAITLYLLNVGTQKHLKLRQPSLWIGFILSLLVLSPSLMLDVVWIDYLPTLLTGPLLAWVYFYWKGNADAPELNHWLKLCFLVGLSSISTMFFVLS
ncbi:MAG: hypothetical protein L3J39_06865 [Verrucomicrobiales bacterium]|nr:hypothetical protein [Verrucomicrobiales bacterium]